MPVFLVVCDWSSQHNAICFGWFLIGCLSTIPVFLFVCDWSKQLVMLRYEYNLEVASFCFLEFYVL